MFGKAAVEEVEEVCGRCGLPEDVTFRERPGTDDCVPDGGSEVKSEEEEEMEE